MSGVAWERTADPATWQARHGGAVLTVSRLPDGWFGLAEVGGRFEYSDPFAARLRAQRWCEKRLDGQR